MRSRNSGDRKSSTLIRAASSGLTRGSLVPDSAAQLAAAGVHINMDGRGRWMDNVFIERLWRSLKYECVYIHAFETARRYGLG